MPEESELEKWARGQNEAARQRAREVEENHACFDSLFKLVGIFVVPLVVFLALWFLVASISDRSSQSFPEEVVKPKDPVCDSNFSIPIENRNIETTPVKDKDILGMLKMPNKEGIVSEGRVICYNENGTYQMFSNGDVLRYGSYEVINGNQLQYTTYGEEGLAKVNGEWQVVTPSPDETTLVGLMISGDVMTQTYENRTSMQYYRGK